MADSADATPYRVLARKYRPQDFTTLIGQEAMVRTLRNAIDTGRIAQAFMLTGVRGVGKTTTARIVARALNCVGPDGKGGPTVDPCGVCDNCRAIAEDRHVDVIEMDAASHTKVEEMRELIAGVRYVPVQARYKIYIVDEVHMLSNASFNALLKTLEEPPPHVKFVFATTEIRKVPVTVLSRCQRFDLRRVPPEQLAAHFRTIAETEKVEIAPEALALIARAADGSVRDGLSLLDQAIAHGGGVVDAAQVRDMLGLADRGRTFDLFDSVMKGDAKTALAQLGELYDSGADPAVTLQDLLELTHWLTRFKVAPDSMQSAPELERRRGGEMAAKLGVGQLSRVWQMLMRGLQETQTAPSPIRAAEMALIRICHAADLPPPGDLVRQLQGGQGAPARAPAPAPNGSGGGGPRAAMAVGASASSAPAGGGSGAATARLVEPAASAPPAAKPVAAPAAPAPDKPNPATFAEVVALFDAKKEGALAFALRGHVHPVRCEPGRLEFRPLPSARADIAGKAAELLSLWTGRRWLVSISGEAGEPTLEQQRTARKDSRMAAAMQHPLVKAALATFPGATLESVRAPDGADAPAQPPSTTLDGDTPAGPDPAETVWDDGPPPIDGADDDFDVIPE